MKCYQKREKISPAAGRRHMEFVARLPCCLTGYHGVQVHHLLRGVVRGTGMRARDCEVLPICPTLHAALHHDGNETRFLESHGLRNAVELAKVLWEHTGDYDYCVNVLKQWRMR